MRNSIVPLRPTKPLPPCLRPDHGDRGWSAPLDVGDLATRLETEGVTDAVAQTHYGFANTWEMAQAYFLETRSQSRKPEPAKPSRSEVMEHLAGLSFALPLLISCISMVLMGFSLWGGNLSAGAAAAVGVGAIGSFIVCGGFIQAMARRGLFYLSTGQPQRCADSVWRWCRAAIIFVLIAAIASMAINEYFGWFPRPLAAVVGTFMFILSLFWISTGILYMLERNLIVAAAASFAIALVGVVHKDFSVPLLGAQLIGIVSAAVLAFAVSAWLLKRAAADHQPEMPERDSLGRGIYLLWPYFAYGSLYYVLLFADRLLAWTAHTNAAELPVDFRATYERASMIGLFAFMLQVGWVHASTVAFYRNLADAQSSFSIANLTRFGQCMRSFYLRRMGIFLPISVLSIALVWIMSRYWAPLRAASGIHTAAWALAGVPLLIIGLWNASLLFGISRPLDVLQAIGWGTVCNIGLGYVLSRALTYDLAIVGFTAGAAVFAVLSTRFALNAFGRLDFYAGCSA